MSAMCFHAVVEPASGRWFPASRRKRGASCALAAFGFKNSFRTSEIRRDAGFYRRDACSTHSCIAQIFSVARFTHYFSLVTL